MSSGVETSGGDNVAVAVLFSDTGERLCVPIGR